MSTFGKVKLQDGAGNDISSTSNAVDVNIKTPAALPVTDNAGSITVDDGSGSLTVDNAGTFAVQATLAAETTKVIGTVNVASGQSVALVAGNAVVGHVINDASAAVIGHVICDSGAVTATLGAETTKIIGTVNVASGQSVALAAGSAVVGHVITDTNSVVAATLNAETTKVIGTVNVAASQSIGATLAAETTKVIGTINVASGQSVALAAGNAVVGHVINDASSAVIGHVIVDSGAVTAAATLAAETTKVIGTVNVASGQTIGATLAAETTKVIGTVNVAGSQTIAVTNTGTFATQSTLAAETTKVIGTVNVAGSQTIAVTNTGTFATQSTLAAETTKVIGTVNQATLTKGTQGTTGITVQELKDAGRNTTSFFTLVPIITTGSEALLSLTGFKSDAAVGATTTPAVVTTAKKYRITSINVTYVAVSTAGSTRMSLRKKVGGTVAVTDPVVWQTTVGATAATAGVAQTMSYDIDLEINAGDGIGVSQLGLGATSSAAAVGYGSIVIAGYEY